MICYCFFNEFSRRNTVFDIIDNSRHFGSNINVSDCILYEPDKSDEVYKENDRNKDGLYLIS